MRCLECYAPRESQMDSKCRECLLAMWDRILARDSREYHSIVLQKEGYLNMWCNGSRGQNIYFDDNLEPLPTGGWANERAVSYPPTKYLRPLLRPLVH